MGDFAGAEQAAATAIGIDPSYEKGQYRLGCARQGLGQHDEAVAAFAVAST